MASESNNVFVATVLDSDRKRLRVSDSATLSDLDLSSLGAWGRQMVGFQDNLTKIYGDIAMGRVLQIRLERLGRIAVFWNLARHVIVYERTVVPSRQFQADEKEMHPKSMPSHSQHPLPGWPVLRKVKEYIEILEDRRSYPDTTALGDDDRERLQRARGCIQFISFQRTRSPVF